MTGHVPERDGTRAEGGGGPWGAAGARRLPPARVKPPDEVTFRPIWKGKVGFSQVKQAYFWNVQHLAHFIHYKFP